MPKISFSKNRPSFEVESGTILMRSLLDNKVPVASSCNGDGVCSKCRIQIIKGLENLSLPNETELFLRDKFNLTKDVRISCQTLVLGDITVDTTYW